MPRCRPQTSKYLRADSAKWMNDRMLHEMNNTCDASLLQSDVTGGKKKIGRCAWRARAHCGRDFSRPKSDDHESLLSSLSHSRTSPSTIFCFLASSSFLSPRNFCRVSQAGSGAVKESMAEIGDEFVCEAWWGYFKLITVWVSNDVDLILIQSV